MITVSIITRRPKERKTYEDFRKAWFHTVGFGTASTLYTVINAFDPREIIVIGLLKWTPAMTPWRFSELTSKSGVTRWMR